jgi:hypothetical protein
MFSTQLQDNHDISFTYVSLSNLLRLPIFIAVCLTIGPNVLRLTTIPSINGIALLILKCVQKQY